MRGDDHSQLSLLRKSHQVVPDGLTKNGIDAHGGLIQDEKGRAVDQGHRQGDAALLSATQVSNQARLFRKFQEVH